jgi:hypothetical protein
VHQLKNAAILIYRGTLHLVTLAWQDIKDLIARR